MGRTGTSERACLARVDEKRARWSVTAAEPDSMAAVLAAVAVASSMCGGDEDESGDDEAASLALSMGASSVQARFCFLMKGLGMKDGLDGRLMLMVSFHPSGVRPFERSRWRFDCLTVTY